MREIAQARKLAAMRDPATLGKYCDPHHFKIRAHTRLVARELANLGNGCNRLILSQPPQTGKSVLASEYFPFWWLIRNPRGKVFVASYAASLAIKKGRAVRELIKAYGLNFGLSLQPGDQAANDWTMRSGGGMRSVGVGGGLTGFPGVLGCVDDPFKDRAQADSRRYRDKVWDWWSGTVVSRMHPEALYLVTTTRWHDDDLVYRLTEQDGTVEEGGKWRVINLPALASSEEDPLGREIGAPMTHPGIEDEDLERLLAYWMDKKESSSVRDWAALYMGDPKPVEGALLSRQVLARQRDFKHEARPVVTAVSVDPSGGGKDEAGVIAGYRDQDGRVYLTHDMSKRMPADQWPRVACALAAQVDADRLILEKNYGGGMVAVVIRTAWEALKRETQEALEALAGDGEVEKNPYDRLPPRLEMVNAHKGKLVRAEPVAQQFIEDRIRFATYMPDCEEQWATWQPDGTESPGRIDATVQLAHALLRMPGSGASVSAAGVDPSGGPGQPGIPGPAGPRGPYV
ncbi:terminase large subunit domain-containing protein [Kitasatospora sp. NPDC056076]|uniref:terminase large subunit domain-containing protein n=1 Tax=Kitasatospora sp. NPDC056076 TaxID=3345703 RepID=UPI0035E0AA9B